MASHMHTSSSLSSQCSQHLTDVAQPWYQCYSPSRETDSGNGIMHPVLTHPSSPPSSSSSSSSFQAKRLGALNKFKSRARNVLVATDVASRGLDIPHVDVVINLDIPTHSKVRVCVCVCVCVLVRFVLIWLHPCRTIYTGWAGLPGQEDQGGPSHL